jgi:hypothetical protein
MRRMRLMRRIALMLAVAFAATAGTAHAGGWASVELGEAPGAMKSGEPWRAELIVKQHGVTPLDGLQPSVTIANDDGVTRTFTARPAGRPGTYVVDVTYPSPGTWQTRIRDGFTDAVPHRLAPMEVSAGSSSGTAGSGFPWPQTLAIAVFALLWMAGWMAVSGRPLPRLRRHGSFKLRGRAA